MDPENPTNPSPEEPKTKEPHRRQLHGFRQGEPAAASKADAPAKPAKSGQTKEGTASACRGSKFRDLSLSADVEKPKVVKAKGSKNIHSGSAHVLSTFNNTIVTITDMKGNVIGGRAP